VIVFLALYAGIVLRPVWRRWFAAREPGVAGFWVRATAFVLDSVIVVSLFLLLLVLLILIIGRFLPWYYGFVLLVPCWWLYSMLCKRRWHATIGQHIAGLRVNGRVAIRMPRSPWLLLALGMVAFIVTMAALLFHLVFLGNRADSDIFRIDRTLWTGTPSDAAV